MEEDKEKGIPKDIFEKDPRIRIVGEKDSGKKESVELREEEEETKEAVEEEPVERLEERERISVEEGRKEGKKEEQKVVEVEESLEQLVSAPTIETPAEERKRGEATYYEFEESEEGLKKIEVGEVVTYGTEPPGEEYPEKETRSLIFWAALGIVIFLIFLGLLIISFLLRL